MHSDDPEIRLHIKMGSTASFLLKLWIKPRFTSTATSNKMMLLEPIDNSNR